MARRAAWAPAAALLLLSPPAAVARVAAPRRMVGASGRCQQLQDTYYSDEMRLAPGEMVLTKAKTTPITMPQGGKYYVTGFEGTEGAREAGRACQQSWDPNNSCSTLGSRKGAWHAWVPHDGWKGSPGEGPLRWRRPT